MFVCVCVCVCGRGVGETAVMYITISPSQYHHEYAIGYETLPCVCVWFLEPCLAVEEGEA